MSAQNVAHGTPQPGQSSFGDRMRFVMWLSALEFGAWTSKDFARAAGKRENQISRWLREDPKPGWEIVKGLAFLGAVNPLWLDDPATPGAEEPELFPRWLAARRRWVEANAPKAEPAIKPKRVKPKDMPRLVAEHHGKVYGVKKKRRTK